MNHSNISELQAAGVSWFGLSTRNRFFHDATGFRHQNLMPRSSKAPLDVAESNSQAQPANLNTSFFLVHRFRQHWASWGCVAATAHPRSCFSPGTKTDSTKTVASESALPKSQVPELLWYDLCVFWDRTAEESLNWATTVDVPTRFQKVGLCAAVEQRVEQRVDHQHWHLMTFVDVGWLSENTLAYSMFTFLDCHA